MRLSAEHVERLRARARADVDDGLTPACQFALALDGQVIAQETFGADDDARFSMWSATKPVFASVVWQLMGEGLLDPAAPVVDTWPEFGRHGKDRVTLDHLLTHTSGFPAAPLDLATIGDREARVAQMEQWSLDAEPGTAFAYHALSAHWVMAELVTRVTGADHRDALRQRVLDPLGLARLELGVPVERQGDLQPTTDTGLPPTASELAESLGLPQLPDLLMPFVIEGGAAEATESPFADLHAWQEPHVLAAGLPGAGGVSDAASLALFYQALLHDPTGLWDPAVRADVTSTVRNTLVGPPLGIAANRTRGLEVQGDDTGSRWRAGNGVVSPTTFGHGGAGGQIGWADPTTGLSFAYLTSGADRNVVRQARQGLELSAAAAACLKETSWA
jgi:CubicO group peptidase (beta-lactamase class C family)